MIFNSTGFTHDGSLRAQKIENELNNAALEAHCSTFLTSLPGLAQLRKINSFKRQRFSFEICPRTETSTEK